MQNTVQQIKASAGSGKTHTIINTFLKHLSANQDNIEEVFSSILAITFTNASAADMKAKLIARLKDIALNQEQSDTSIVFTKNEAINSIEAFIKHYSALNIRTIDSFLFMLLKQNSINLHLPAEFEPLFKSQDFYIPLLEELAFISLHKNTNPQSDEAKILKPYYEKMYASLYHTSNKKGFLGLENVRSKILDVCEILANLDVEKIANLTDEEEIQAKYTKEITKYANIIEKIRELVDTHKIKEKKDYREGIQAFDYNSKVIKAFYGEPSVIIDNLFYATALKTLRKSEYGEKVIASIEAYLADLNALYKSCFLYENALVYAPLLPLAKIVIEMQAYEEFNKGKILSSRISALLHSLIHAEDSHLPAMLERLPFQLESVLIDEFQDTSSAQWNLIRPFSEEAISRGGTLTYVGDVKQAIYSWRGGNSSLFESIKNEINAHSSTKTLDTNWRSSPNVVKFNNFIFSQFKDLDFTKKIASSTGKFSTIEPEFSSSLVALFNDVEQGIAPKYQGNLENEGRVFLHRLIPESYRGNAPLHEEIRKSLCNTIKHRSTNFTYGDMAILVRNNRDCKLFAEWLTAEGIPVITEGALNIASNFLVSQCISFLEYLKNTDDELALWHIVGFEGLLEKENIIPIDKYLESKKHNNSLLSCIEKENKELYSLLCYFIELKNKASVYVLLSEIVEKYSVFKRFASQSGFVARLLELSLQAQKKGIYSLISFIDYWHKEGQEEQIPMPDGINAVRILTIHKSKGAEFNLVFMYDKGEVGEAKGLKHYVYEDFSFIAPHSSFHKDYKEDVTTIAIETINLLYVAFTRAKKELHVLYLGTEKEDTLLETMLKNTHNEVHTCPILNAELYGADIEEVEENREIESNMTEEKVLPALQYRKLSLNFAELEESTKHTLSPKRRGNLVHACMEHYFKLAKHDKDADNRIIPMLLAKEDIEKQEKKNFEAELACYFSWLKEQKDFEMWAENAIVEQSLVNDIGKMYRCDIYYIDANTIHIIDFKTGDENENYHKQIQNYASILKNMDIYKDKKINALLVYLDAQKIVTVNCEGI